MSEGSSVLLNMGAELATAGGINPSVGPQKAAAVGENGDFATVLQSAMTTKGETSEVTPLIKNELKTSPLMLGMSEDSGNPLLEQNFAGLALMPGGKDLPPDEQDIAWQTILSEYDSNDPDTPRVMVAAGDESGYQVEELTADDINRVLAEDQRLAREEQGFGNRIQNPESELADLHDQKLQDERQPSAMDNAVAVKSTTVDLKGEKANTGVLSALENGSTQKASGAHTVEAAQLASNARHANQQTEMANQSKLEYTAEQNQLEMNGQFKHELSKEVGVKTDTNTLADSILSKPGSSIVSNSTNTGLLGSSAYSAVSALSSSAGSGLISANVIANMTIPPQNPAWGDVIGDRVQWMVNQNIQEARIRLNPPELGMLEVRVQIGNDQQTSISFSSPHSQVRDALETAVPRLREMFSDSGLSLGNVDVSHHSMAGQEQESQSDTGSGKQGNLQEPTTDSNTTGINLSSARADAGLLDLYA